jgi:hypothetical protein
MPAKTELLPFEPLGVFPVAPAAPAPIVIV